MCIPLWPGQSCSLPLPLPSCRGVSPHRPPPHQPHFGQVDLGRGAGQRPSGSEALPPSHTIADTSDQSWEEEEEEEEDLEEEEEEDDDDDEDTDVSLEEETPVKQVKRLAPQKHTSVAKVREGCPPTPQRLLRNLDQASPVECAEARGNTCQVPSGSLLCPWALPELPIMLVFGFQKKKVEKEEVAVR